MRFASNVSKTNSNNLRTEQTIQLPNTILQLSICNVEEEMAPTPKEAAPQDPSRLENFACKFCRQRTPVASCATQRRPGAEINTPLRWGIVTEYQKLLGDRSRVLPGGLKSLQSLFPWKNQVSSANASSRNSCRKHLHRSVQFVLISLAFVHDVAADESRSQKRSSRSKLIDINNRP